MASAPLIRLLLFNHRGHQLRPRCKGDGDCQSLPLFFTDVNGDCSLKSNQNLPEMRTETLSYCFVCSSRSATS
jgi:hypothetical protein